MFLRLLIEVKLNSRIIKLELNGEAVLGFDTGLNSQAFAQAKMAQFITSPGTIVFPGGRVQVWQPGGVTEIGLEGTETMIVWGPAFPGEKLSALIGGNRKDEALDALRFWLRARMVIEENSGAGMETPYPGPAGALIITKPEAGFPAGTVFFPPFRLLKRSLEAEGAQAVLDAERWVHPDLEGAAAISFSAGALLYSIFCDLAPFTRNDPDELRQDMREAVFTPPGLASPGLDPEMAEHIKQLLGRMVQNREEKPRPAPDSIIAFIGQPCTKPVSSWIKPLGDVEIAKIRAEQEQYSRKKALSVKTRRFVIRNTAIITVSFVIVVVLLLFIRSYIKHQEEQPSTRGMDPVEVAETYYGAFGALDHMLMDACVTGKAGKGDIETVINLFVISKMHQAYEMAQTNFMSAQDWVDAGRQATDKTVFGVTDLNVQVLSVDEAGGTASLEADYILWMPESFFREADDTAPADDGGASGGVDMQAPLPPSLPGGLATKDSLGLVLRKGAWRIAEINRESSRMDQ